MKCRKRSVSSISIAMQIVAQAPPVPCALSPQPTPLRQWHQFGQATGSSAHELVMPMADGLNAFYITICAASSARPHICAALDPGLPAIQGVAAPTALRGMALPPVATWLRSIQRGAVGNALPLCPHDGSPLHHSSTATRMWRQTELTLLPAVHVYTLRQTQGCPRVAWRRWGTPTLCHPCLPLAPGGSLVVRAV